MRHLSLFFISVFTVSSVSYAQEIADETTPETDWTIGASGGAALVKNSSNQKFASLSVNKDFGDSYAGLAASYVDSGNVAGLIDSIPASTTSLTVSAGTSFDAFNLDGHLSIGDRNFDSEALSRNGRMVTIDSGGSAFGAGLSASYDFVIGERTFLSPMIAVDYNTLDIARLVNLPNGDQVGVGNKEDGVTGTVGIALQQLFGPNDDHLISLLTNLVTTSNTTSFSPGSTQYPALQALALREEAGQKDSWAEVGGSVSFGLSSDLRLDFTVIQTIGFLDNDTTLLSAGLRQSF